MHQLAPHSKGVDDQRAALARLLPAVRDHDYAAQLACFSAFTEAEVRQQADFHAAYCVALIQIRDRRAALRELEAIAAKPRPNDTAASLLVKLPVRSDVRGELASALMQLAEKVLEDNLAGLVTAGTCARVAAICGDWPRAVCWQKAAIAGVEASPVGSKEYLVELRRNLEHYENMKIP